ncbi:cation:proton antiporter [Candidatus Woesearchaeota archaeon]|nr:cation:proton antiporter [Candidatus Woesearchaeota archaeon]
MVDIFLEIGVLIIVASIFAFVLQRIKQPLIPAYIATGVLLGPGFGQLLGLLGITGFAGFITNTELIRNLSEMGIAFLLFIVGLEIDFKKLKDVGLVSSLGGFIHVPLIGAGGFFLAKLMGLSTIASFYMGTILAFSSTMVVVKILSDRKEIDTLHGRITIGFLLMEDVVAVLVLATMSTLQDFSFIVFGIALLKGVFLGALVLLITWYILPPLFKFAARTQELLFLLAISTCFLYSLLAKYVGYLLYWILQLPVAASLLSAGAPELVKPGFPIVIGAFMAGLGLANLPYRLEIIGRVKPLKDFFSTLFFVSLGMELVFINVGHLTLPLIFFTLFVLLIKPLLLLLVVAVFGYTKRTSFFTGLSLAQISEFSLIIAAQAFILGQIPQEIFLITVALAVITIATTTYLLKYKDRIYAFASPFLGFVEKFAHPSKSLAYLPLDIDKEVVLVGYDRLGFNIFRTLKKQRKNFVVVDYNPDIIKHLIRDRVHCIYGDIADPEILERINLKKAKIVISTITDKNASLLLIKKAKHANRAAVVFVTAHFVEDALNLYDAGADYVILPHFLGGERVSLILEEISVDISKVLKNKINHINELHTRVVHGHQHPQHLS